LLRDTIKFAKLEKFDGMSGHEKDKSTRREESKMPNMELSNN